MSKKKTVEVEFIKTRTNEMLNLETISQEEKKALSCFLEEILHKTGNYKGYNNSFDWTNATEEYRKANNYTRRYH